MVLDYIIEDLMEEVVERKGSDIHISAGLPPYIRISGHLTATDRDPLTPKRRSG
jgi:twitching motility protein PilT